MTAPELCRPTNLPDTEAMEVLPRNYGQIFKKLYIGALGGNEPFNLDEEFSESSVIDWSQWEETEDLQAEWAEQERLRDEQARQVRLYWMSRMELGQPPDPDDATPVVAIEPMPQPEYDVPSFMRQVTRPIRQVKPALVKPLINLAPQLREPNKSLVTDQPVINRQAVYEDVSTMEFKEPDETFLNDTLALPLNESAPSPVKVYVQSGSAQSPNIVTEPREALVEEIQTNVMPAPGVDPNEAQPETEVLTPDDIKFTQLLTRAELIVRLAESYANVKNKLPSLWRVERIISKDPKYRNLVANKLFMDTLKGYEAMGRLAFVIQINELMKNDKYGRECYQMVRAAHLLEIGVIDSPLPKAEEEVEHGN